MRALEFPLLADQNIDRDVVAALRDEGRDVVTAEDRRLGEADDATVLATAVAEGRVVITHDGDFGSLAVLAGATVIGIIYLRPGHVDPEFVVGMLTVLSQAVIEVQPPFIVVVQRRENDVRIRFRPVPVTTILGD